MLYIVEFFDYRIILVLNYATHFTAFKESGYENSLINK